MPRLLRTSKAWRQGFEPDQILGSWENQLYLYVGGAVSGEQTPCGHISICSTHPKRAWSSPRLDSARFKRGDVELMPGLRRLLLQTNSVTESFERRSAGSCAVNKGLPNQL